MDIKNTLSFGMDFSKAAQDLGKFTRKLITDFQKKLGIEVEVKGTEKANKDMQEMSSSTNEAVKNTDKLKNKLNEVNEQGKKTRLTFRDIASDLAKISGVVAGVGYGAKMMMQPAAEVAPDRMIISALNAAGPKLADTIIKSLGQAGLEYGFTNQETYQQQAAILRQSRTPIEAKELTTRTQQTQMVARAAGMAPEDLISMQGAMRGTKIDQNKLVDIYASGVVSGITKTRMPDYMQNQAQFMQKMSTSTELSLESLNSLNNLFQGQFFQQDFRRREAATGGLEEAFKQLQGATGAAAIKTIQKFIPGATPVEMYNLSKMGMMGSAEEAADRRGLKGEERTKFTGEFMREFIRNIGEMKFRGGEGGGFPQDFTKMTKQQREYLQAALTGEVGGSKIAQQLIQSLASGKEISGKEIEAVKAGVPKEAAGVMGTEAGKLMKFQAGWADAQLKLSDKMSNLITSIDKNTVALGQIGGATTQIATIVTAVAGVVSVLGGLKTLPTVLKSGAGMAGQGIEAVTGAAKVGANAVGKGAGFAAKTGMGSLLGMATGLLMPGNIGEEEKARAEEKRLLDTVKPNENFQKYLDEKPNNKLLPEEAKPQASIEGVDELTGVMREMISVLKDKKVVNSLFAPAARNTMGQNDNRIG
jgi:hypothetical protein